MAFFPFAGPYTAQTGQRWVRRKLFVVGNVGRIGSMLFIVILILAKLAVPVVGHIGARGSETKTDNTKTVAIENPFIE